jgi:UDP-glucose 4-epimerase
MITTNTSEFVKGKRVLITGGTGSFGSSVARMFLSTQVEDVRIFSRDEKKQDDMRKAFDDPRLSFYIGDVRDLSSLNSAMRGVDYVFHAAALKQVPSCEFFPAEAVRTNILGTQNVIDAVQTSNVSRLVLLSTDKAVYPINAMGISKAMAEKILVAQAAQQKTGHSVLCATRYGNVLRSRGSVVPLFMSQARAGLPLTITDPQMTRFLMTLEDSVELVLYALMNGQGGDIFVQKARAATIETIAEAVHKYCRTNSGYKIIGTRHGEKLFETLVSREELHRAEDLGKYYRIPADTRDLNYERYFHTGSAEISSSADFTSHNASLLSVDEVERILRESICSSETRS